MLADIGDIGQPPGRRLVEMVEAGERAAVEQVRLKVPKRAFDFTLGEKRAMQTVVVMAYKFSPSRTLSIR